MGCVERVRTGILNKTNCQDLQGNIFKPIYPTLFMKMTQKIGCLLLEK